MAILFGQQVALHLPGLGERGVGVGRAVDARAGPETNQQFVTLCDKSRMGTRQRDIP